MSDHVTGSNYKTYSAVEVFNTSHELAANVNFFNRLCTYRWITKKPTQTVIDNLLKDVGLILKDKLSTMINLSTLSVTFSLFFGEIIPSAISFLAYIFKYKITSCCDVRATISIPLMTVGGTGWKTSNGFFGILLVVSKIRVVKSGNLRYVDALEF